MALKASLRASHASLRASTGREQLAHGKIVSPYSAKIVPCSQRLTFATGPTLPSRCAVVQSASQDKVQAIALERGGTEEDPSPFYESLLRSLLLGVSSGVIFELAHLAFKVLSMADLNNLTTLVPQNADQLAPLFALDHVIAIGVALFLYVVDAATIAPRSLEGKSRMSITKLMLPMNLRRLKKALYYLINPKQVATAFPGSGDSASPRALLRSEAMKRTGSFSSAATATLDMEELQAPTKPRPSPPNNNGDDDEEEKRRRRSSGATAGTKPRRPIIRTPSFNDMPKVLETPSDKRARELKERRSYLKNFWYAAALSQNVKVGETHRVEMLGRTIVLWRDPDTKQVRCLDNICPHRGAPLDKGWVKKDAEGKKGHSCVVCPYHGWAFDGEGKLKEVPSASADSALPKRSLVDSYVVEEKGGFVWLFFGSPRLPADERPPIPFTPELEDPSWRAVYGEIEFECPHWGVFENAIDMAHIHYLHGDSFGNSSKPEIKDMQTSRDTFSISASFRIHNKPVSPLWNWTSTPDVPVKAQAMLPSSSNVTIKLGAGVSMITFVNTVPISATRAVNRFCLIRNFALTSAFDPWARKSMYKILGEDKVMVELLEPEKISNELSLGPDLPQIAFRQLRQDWIDMGYGVDPEATQGHKGTLNL